MTINGNIYLKILLLLVIIKVHGNSVQINYIICKMDRLI